jgi:hypothetical protein
MVHTIISALKRAWCGAFHYKHWRYDIYRNKPNSNDFWLKLHCEKCGFIEPLEFYAD